MPSYSGSRRTAGSFLPMLRVRLSIACSSSSTCRCRRYQYELQFGMSRPTTSAPWKSTFRLRPRAKPRSRKFILQHLPMKPIQRNIRDHEDTGPRAEVLYSVQRNVAKSSAEEHGTWGNDCNQCVGKQYAPSRSD